MLALWDIVNAARYTCISHTDTKRIGSCHICKLINCVSEQSLSRSFAHYIRCYNCPVTELLNGTSLPGIGRGQVSLFSDTDHSRWSGASFSHCLCVPSAI